jgi:hypothetical protein
MHTALVSRLLRDQTLWEETTVSEEESAAAVHHEAAMGQSV